ncbi:hypothetical protein [Streptomyces sp. NPDC057438]|uniref:hypothetical protein n=1 Tax=Streptomyces sp. NPDC057438 TaxID=3346133 RepID=UPI00369308EA
MRLPARWQEAFEVLMGRIAGRFARVEQRRRARAFVLGLSSGLPRKKGTHTVGVQRRYTGTAGRIVASSLKGRSPGP